MKVIFVNYVQSQFKIVPYVKIQVNVINVKQIIIYIMKNQAVYLTVMKIQVFINPNFIKKFIIKINFIINNNRHIISR